MTLPWWNGAVIYQIYPRSFQDSNQDGIGDLQGIIDRLDHLSWLGVDAIWLNPITPSPNEDWGYDVTDYCDVHPELGSLAVLDKLTSLAGEHHIKVLLDLVPNHTSDRHPWFLDESQHSRYVWADPGPDGGPPNNWVSVFGGESAWTLHATGRYYLHNFLRSQPDLDWSNDEVRESFVDIQRFWFDRGIAGFRIDVAHALVKDRLLRDNPVATELDHATERRIGQRSAFNMNRPEVHDIYRRWRDLADSYDPPRVLVGETYVFDPIELASYYGTGGDELDLAFNFPFAWAPLEGTARDEIVRSTYEALPEGAEAAWFASNHDVGRFPTHVCRGDERKIRCALMMLLTLRGTTFLYYGDEIGMTDAPIARDDLRDPVGKRFWPDETGRDPCRTPMQWSAAPHGGFTDASVTPWLPLGDLAGCNVETQRGDPGSTINLCHDLIALRQRSSDLRTAAFTSLGVSDGVWVFERGRTLVILNLTDERARTPTTGEVLVSTNRAREGELVTALDLDAWEGVILATADSNRR